MFVQRFDLSLWVDGYQFQWNGAVLDLNLNDSAVIEMR